VNFFVRQVLYQCFQFSASDFHVSVRAVVGSFYGVFLFYLFFLWFSLFLSFRYCVVLAKLHVMYLIFLCGAAWRVVI
jgi:hypothetical protein